MAAANANPSESVYPQRTEDDKQLGHVSIVRANPPIHPSFSFGSNQAIVGNRLAGFPKVRSGRNG